MGSTEDERSVGQTADRTVVELVAANAVGDIELRHFADGAVVFVEPVHRTDPQIALVVLDDGRHVGARHAADGVELAGAGIVAQQAVAVGSYPDKPAHVLIQVGGDERRAAHAAFHLLPADGKVGDGHGVGTNDLDVVHEARHEHTAILQRQQAGRERDGADIQPLESAATGVVACDLIAQTGAPHVAVAVLCHVELQSAGILAHHAERAAVDLALQHPFAGGDPKAALAVDKQEVGAGGTQFGKGHGGRFLGLDVVMDEPAVLRQHPQVPLPVGGQRQNGLLTDVVVQMTVVVEELVVAIVDDVSFIRGAHPDVVAGVTEQTGGPELVGFHGEIGAVGSGQRVSPYII